MSRTGLVLLRALAMVSNVLAWLLVVGGCLAAISAPLAAYMHDRLHELDLPEHYFLWQALCGVSTALGALLVLKRKPIGVLLALAPAVVYAVWGNLVVATTFALVVLLLLGLPVALFRVLSKESKTGGAVA